MTKPLPAWMDQLRREGLTSEWTELSQKPKPLPPLPPKSRRRWSTLHPAVQIGVVVAIVAAFILVHVPLGFALPWRGEELLGFFLLEFMALGPAVTVILLSRREIARWWRRQKDAAAKRREEDRAYEEAMRERGDLR